jgi:hypothetical protein
VIRMVRAGYTGRPVPDGLTVADHARHAAALLRRLDAAPAHRTGRARQPHRPVLPIAQTAAGDWAGD